MTSTQRNLRDRFWRAFWLRQQKNLPPAAQVMVSGCRVQVDADSKVPAIHIEVGREWTPTTDDRRRAARQYLDDHYDEDGRKR